MEKYIEQLLELMKEAPEKRPVVRTLEIPEEMEALRGVMELEASFGNEETMESIFGIPKIYFPDEKHLSDQELKRLKGGITELWHSFNYEADFRKGEFNDREQYTKLVESWSETVPFLKGTNGVWHLELFDYEKYWDEEEMRYMSEEEYAKKYY